MLRRELRQMTGVTLIELLVTLVIVSVGVLGVAGLQATSLQLTRDVNYKLTAVQLANDVFDRVRINRDQTYALAITDVPPAGATNCVSSTCSAAQLATYDLARWACSVRSTNLAGETYAICSSLSVSGALPLGASSIAEVSGAEGTYEVQIRWAIDGVQTLCGAREAGQACQSLTIRTSVQ
jgi:type IV pilus assembly protein PilV